MSVDAFPLFHGSLLTLLFLFNSKQMSALRILAFYLSLPSRTCPHILSRFFASLFCVSGAAAGDPLQYSHRTVVGPAFERPSLILTPCSCFNTNRSGQPVRKLPPPLSPPPLSLSSVLYQTPLCPHHITTRAEKEGESPSSPVNTLLHSKRHKRKGHL